MEKATEKIKGYLIRVKEYNSKETGKKSGIAICINPNAFDDNPTNNVWITLWFNNEKAYNLYTRHQDVYDFIKDAQPDEYLVEASYHFNDKNFRELDDIVFIEQNKTEQKFDGFTDEQVEKITTKAKEDANAFMPANKIQPITRKDWEVKQDKIALGKVRHGVVIAFIENGAKLTTETKTEINNWVKFIMEGT